MRPDSQPPPAAEPPEATSFSFAELIAQEYARLDRAPAGHPGGHQPPTIAPPGRTDEPWVSFTDRDLFGVALSGGGIRSATFNLGLLQALERKQLLKHVDYLSTVSGGGYIGGFWTAWRSRPRGGVNDPRTFPGAAADTPAARGGTETREQPEIRHLREFSRFLMPRVGFFHMETWAGIVTILGGMLPSLTAAVSVLALLNYAWFYASHRLIDANPLWSWVCLGAVMLVYQMCCEFSWRRAGKAGNTHESPAVFLLFALSAAALVGVFWLYWRNFWMPDELESWLGVVQAAWQADAGPSYPVATGFDSILFGPAAVAALAGGVLLVGRAISSRMISDREAIRWSGGFDRAAARCLAPAVMWAGLALAWELCHWLLHQEWKFAATSGSVATFGVLFVWLRDWLTKPTEENLASALARRIAQKLKPMVPQLLAVAFVVSMYVAVGVMVQSHGLGSPVRVAAGAGTALFLIGGTLLFFDPARVGMHDFYRSRICRCFLGAARAGQQRGKTPVAEQFGDDRTFGELRVDPHARRPIHLVCCAANNLAGDTLGSLYRGARSATLSPLGLSLGNHAARCEKLRLSSALTASAAAFNSQMGRISMDLGPAVAFVMSAFNLRLGLWVPHPLLPNPRPPSLVGRPFFYEMFGLTNCDPLPEAGPARPARLATLLRRVKVSARNAVQRVRSHRLAQKKAVRDLLHKAGGLSARGVALSRHRLHDIQFLHLSDGAHFENLGLYELVRRHCRYIIVSDCGTDSEVVFDDLAIALRSIREDFGVEIDLDVRPLRRAEGSPARQHAVVGTIHYDGFGGTDKGTIVLFKPTLTGDEPADVTQYGARHPDFPHESTGDQFYDEAQWESYRRLGEHAGDSVFRHLDEPSGKLRRDAQFVENVFLEVTQRWHAGQDRQSDVFLALTERCAAIESAIVESAPAKVRAEFFPEVAAAFSARAGGDSKSPAPSAESTLEDEVRTVHYMMLVAQVMEDAWVAADLENNWSHPLNEGWMNYFQRWASTPSFRRWWPILRPIYNIRFRDFVRDRFGIRIKDQVARQEPAGPGALLNLVALADPREVMSGFAWEHWVQRHGPADLTGRQVFDYRLTLESAPTGLADRPFQAGFLLCQFGRDHEGTFVQWQVQHLFVPLSLNGSGIVARLLDAIVNHFRGTAQRGQGPDRIQVIFDEEARAGAATPRRDPGHRLHRVHLINFYKSRGFVIAAAAGPGGNPRGMRLALK